MKITKGQLREIIKESIMLESPHQLRRSFIDSELELVDSNASYPYGRNRGDVRSYQVFRRKDGQPISDSDLDILTAIEVNNHPLGGSYDHKRSEDRMSVVVNYYRHTAG